MAPHELKEGFRKTYAEVRAAWEERSKKEFGSARAEKEKNEREI